MQMICLVESEEKLIKNLNVWKNAMEGKGLKVNMNKTKVVISAILEDGHVVFVVDMLLETRYRQKQVS